DFGGLVRLRHPGEDAQVQLFGGGFAVRQAVQAFDQAAGTGLQPALDQAVVQQEERVRRGWLELDLRLARRVPEDAGEERLGVPDRARRLSPGTGEVFLEYEDGGLGRAGLLQRLEHAGGPRDGAGELLRGERLRVGDPVALRRHAVRVRPRREQA